MPPKARVPAPIDRPLSKAYLREFSGWSTAFPPGLSDPTSLRIMENVAINRDGSARVRPGLRYLSFAGVALGIDVKPVGTHEAFFLNDGTKAYLFAVREADLTVGFRVLVGSTVKHLTDVGVAFSVPQTEAVLNFTAATTYVKYLQIDNKIFALSNAGETLRYFTVGDTKLAKKLSSIERPSWDLTDKLTVVEPDAAWIAAPTATRHNYLLNPSFETNLTSWAKGSLTEAVLSSTVSAHDGSYSARLESLPTRTNMAYNPLGNVATYGVTGWSASGFGANVFADGDCLEVTGTGVNLVNYALTDNSMPVVASTSYKVAYDLITLTDIDTNGGDGGTTSTRVVFYWYNSTGGLISSTTVATGSGRPVATATSPAGAVTLKVAIGYTNNYSSATLEATVVMRFKNVVIAKGTEATTMFSGDTGANYFWTGTTGHSPSVYHPPADVTLTSTKMAATAALDYVASAYFQADPTVRAAAVTLNYYNASNALTGTFTSAAGNDADNAWTRFSKVGTAPAATTQAEVVLKVSAVPRGEYHYVDSAMLEQASVVAGYFDGNTADTGTVIRSWDGAENGSASTEVTYAAATSIPPAETKTVNTLISSTAASNTFSFGYFYTFSNEIGESAASQVTVVKTQRSWAAWKWETPNASGEPSGTYTPNPDLAADQLVAYMPQAAYDAAKLQGAISWNLYMLTWSDQDSVPPEGVLLDTQAITAGGTYSLEGWIRHSPQQTNFGYSAQLPSEVNRYNYSKPSSAAQGIVAADRLVLVDDPVAPAVIRWSSNQQGEYTNFTAAKGGGYKTLTSGNMFVAAAAKLWQNPQSVDTLTILCQGIDGQSTGYYMAPATVSSQSEQSNVMGFEETTATPGTTSPYGCEVLNNALYHPLDTELMKSTATNYNINHKPMTEQIYVDWARLANKHRIVSAAHDGRIYYIVHNPSGAELEDGCMGNEIWVFDAMATTGTWSRWLIQANSLRKIEFAGGIYMSVVRPDGIYYLDPFYDRDDVVDPADRSVDTAFIAWRLETNTQGANRAHDAWCHLQQVNLSLGNFQGQMRWGIRSVDIHGKVIEYKKDTKDVEAPSSDGLPYDVLDFLKVARDVMEWRLFAESIDGVMSTGQIDFVQYRYTPVSVNIGYEYGEVETFEYSRSQIQATDRTTANGVPQPFADVTRP